MLHDALGNEMDGFELPEPPASPLQIVDFNGDGMNDIMLVSRSRIYGFQLVRRIGAGAPYATLVAGLLIAVVVVYVIQQGPSVQQKMRSTDRVD